MFLYVGIRTYVLARAMACDCSEVDRDPFGSGTPSLGLKKLRIDIAGRRAVCNACLWNARAVKIDLFISRRTRVKQRSFPVEVYFNRSFLVDV